MNKTIFGILAGFVICFSAYAGSGEMPLQLKQSPEFIQFKSLAGKWEGISTEPDGKTSPAKAEYVLSSGGSVVVEKLFAGTEHEMTSVYTDTKGKLGMTHYCAIGNHPELTLQKAEGNQYEFSLAPINSIDANEPHMHDLKIAIQNADNIIQTWTYYVNGQPQGSTVIMLSRIKS